MNSKALNWISGVLTRRLQVYVPLLAMGGILALSSVPGVIEPDAAAPLRLFVWVPPSIQNLLHIPVYAGLAFLWNWWLSGMLRPVQAAMLTLLIVICFGMFDEWYQSFTPGRFSSWGDVLFNSIGAVLGVLAFRFLKKH